MKNIHVIATENSSRLWINNLLQGKLELSKEMLIGSNTAQNIYITNDEEIKEGDWFWKSDCNMIFKADYTPHKGCKKVILTTDQDLIAEGVQAIDDEFLEWFVKNPSCEFVEIQDWYNIYLSCCRSKEECHCNKKRIIIPKEEPKQETLEEALQKFSPLKWMGSMVYNKTDMIEFAKSQQEQNKNKYSEEEVLEFLNKSCDYIYDSSKIGTDKKLMPNLLRGWFEQFKNK